jgi:hypothetical protein
MIEIVRSINATCDLTLIWIYFFALTCMCFFNHIKPKRLRFDGDLVKNELYESGFKFLDASRVEQNHLCLYIFLHANCNVFIGLLCLYK